VSRSKMRYLQSHFEWLKLSYSSIRFLLDVCLAAHVEEFLDGPLQCQTASATPAEAGGLPLVIDDSGLLGVQRPCLGRPPVFRFLVNVDQMVTSNRRPYARLLNDLPELSIIRERQRIF
jgi:hypothetical protein